MTIVKFSDNQYPKYYPKGKIVNRGIALGIDFLTVWFVSGLLGSSNIGIQFTQIIVFVILWFISRVLIAYNNRGQSLGRWAVNLKSLEVEQTKIVGRVPQLSALVKRETILCFCTLLLSICLGNILVSPTAILLLLPLIIDCGAALSDTLMGQALHDRYARTIIVSSRRGYSLERKFQRLVENFRQNVRR